MTPDQYVTHCVRLRIAQLTKLLAIRVNIDGELRPVLEAKHCDWIQECESLKLWLTRLEMKIAS